MLGDSFFVCAVSMIQFKWLWEEQKVVFAAKEICE